MHYERFSFPTSYCRLLPTNQSLLLHFNIFHHPPSLYRLFPPQKKEIIQVYHHYQPPLLGHFGHPHIPSLLTRPFSQQTVTNTNDAPTRGRFWTHPFPLSIYYLAYSIYTHQYQPLTTFPLPFPLSLLLSLLLLLLLLSSLFSSKLPLPSIYLSTNLSIYLSTHLSPITEYRSFEAALGRSYVRFVRYCRLHRLARMKAA